MSVRTLSAQPPRFFDICRAFQANFPRFFSEIALDPSSPKAEVGGSNPLGRANKIKYLASDYHGIVPASKHIANESCAARELGALRLISPA
jgi:hypothetical protein